MSVRVKIGRAGLPDHLEASQAPSSPSDFGNRCRAALRISRGRCPERLGSERFPGASREAESMSDLPLRSQLAVALGRTAPSVPNGGPRNGSLSADGSASSRPRAADQARQGPQAVLVSATNGKTTSDPADHVGDDAARRDRHECVRREHADRSRVGPAAAPTARYGVLECDENTSRWPRRRPAPTSSRLMNLSRDQMDRAARSGCGRQVAPRPGGVPARPRRRQLDDPLVTWGASGAKSVTCEVGGPALARGLLVCPDAGGPLHPEDTDDEATGAAARATSRVPAPSER